MQAAGINDTSYSVRHGGGAQRIVAACFSALGTFAYRVQVLRETFTVNYGRCQCRYSPSDYRRRMSHCLSVCLFSFQYILHSWHAMATTCQLMQALIVDIFC